MSNVLVSFLASLGASAWIYNRFMGTTGGNTQKALITAAVSGVAIFILMWMLLAMLTSMID